MTSYSARENWGLKSTGHAGGIQPQPRIAGQGLLRNKCLREMGTGLVADAELMGCGKELLLVIIPVVQRASGQRTSETSIR